MYVKNGKDLKITLQNKLREYVSLMTGSEPYKNKIKCFVHKDNTPSLYFDPKQNFRYYKCFSCQAYGDIFNAANILEGLPCSGPELMTVTIPALAKKMNLEVEYGKLSEEAILKIKYQTIANDIRNILLEKGDKNNEYILKRNWQSEHFEIASISKEEMINALLDKGWTQEEIIETRMVEWSKFSICGEDRVTMPIRSHTGTTVGFMYRMTDGTIPKYVNTPDSIIYSKKNILFGLDKAISHGNAKKAGLYIVEGQGDLAQLNRLGILNAVAVGGSSLSSEHLLLIKTIGISKINLCFDWDIPGTEATKKVLKQEISGIQGLSVNVINRPEGFKGTDIDELLNKEETLDLFLASKPISAFEWLLQQYDDDFDKVQVCLEMIPSIASEPTAIQRDSLCKVLSEYTEVPLHAIVHDMESIRGGKEAEKKERIMASAIRYMKGVTTDPENIYTLMTRHEEDLESIQKEYNSNTIGVSYQLSRYDALQEKRLKESTEGNATEFNMSYYTLFKNAFSGGGDWTSGVLIYIGGRPNSGKTATGIAIATDIAMTDKNAIVITHFTDDNYVQVEPRFKSNIASMLKHGEDLELKIGMVVNPILNCPTDQHKYLYDRADEKLRQLIEEERLVIIDSEDGSTLSALEKVLKYIRSRYPKKKIYVFCDNTHNYRDFPNLDPMNRMRQISTSQADFAMKYNCCLTATVEYRKNMPGDASKIKLPVDDDIADARALMYRPNAIIHVYNDLHDRKDDSEIFWYKNNKKMPRLMLIVSKNKITEFKDKLFMDLDIETVTPKQRKREDVESDFRTISSQKEEEEEEEEDKQETTQYKTRKRLKIKTGYKRN